MLRQLATRKIASFSSVKRIVDRKQVIPLLAASNGPSSIDWKRYYGMTPHRDSGMIVGGLVLLGVGLVAQHANGLYAEYQANKANAPPTVEDPKITDDPAAAEAREKAAADQAKTEAKEKAKAKTESTNSGESAASSFASSWFARNFYEGGFEDKMTKREAALILGVRESATPERIKEAHKRILMINHPDRGGSAFIAAKINEAKDLLLKGK